MGCRCLEHVHPTSQTCSRMLSNKLFAFRICQSCILCGLVRCPAPRTASRVAGASAATRESIMRRALPSRQFVINPNSNLILEVGDITKWSGDAIVNAANERMLGGGGVDGAIHRAAGPELLTACRAVPLERGVRCRTGQAKITAAGQLKAEFVIHTVGPVYDEWDNEDAEKLLYMSYANCLKLANNNSVSSIAFPAISTGVYGYPIKAAAQVAVRAVKDNVDAVASVYFILFDQRNYDACVAAAEALFNEPPVQQPADPAAGNSAASPATSNAASGAVVAPTANADDATTSGAPSDRGAAAAAAAFDGATATQKAEVDADDLSLTIGSGKKGVLPAVTASGKTQPETSTNKSIYLQDPGEQPSMCEEPAAIAISESAVPPPSRGDHAGVSLNVDAIGGASVDAAGGGGAGDNMSLDGDAPEASVADGVGAEGAEAVGQGLQVSPQILPKEAEGEEVMVDGVTADGAASAEQAGKMEL